MISRWTGTGPSDRKWAPDWIQKNVFAYGVYGGPGNTDPSFVKRPRDSLDRLCMFHDIGWAYGEDTRKADVQLYYGLLRLPMNPFRWAEQPPRDAWDYFYAVAYHAGALAFFYATTYADRNKSNGN
jgi:hypothetical protein